MLKFIKNIFAKKEAPEEKISLDELDSWLDKKTKPMFDELNARINEIIEKINNEKAEANENLKTLENAQLQNQKIPERAKIMMQGNREGFIKKVSLFFNNIDLKHGIHNELIEKCLNIENEINSLGESTARNYHILNEFFAREVEEVAANIKTTEACSKGLANSINHSKISNINKIKKDIIDLKNKIKLKKGYSMDVESNSKILQNNKDKKIGIENNINGLKSSPEYLNYEKLLEEKGKAEIKIKEIETGLFRDFSVLEKALKKYAKVVFEYENLILEYLENPAFALIDDADFKILKILGNLKISIESDKLDLEEKKKYKAIEKINSLDGAYFSNLIEGYKDAKKIFNRLTIETESNNSRKNFDLLRVELKNVEEDIEKANNKILIISKELEKINIAKLKGELQKDIFDAANVKITVF